MMKRIELLRIKKPKKNVIIKSDISKITLRSMSRIEFDVDL